MWPPTVWGFFCCEGQVPIQHDETSYKKKKKGRKRKRVKNEAERGHQAAKGQQNRATYWKKHNGSFDSVGRGAQTKRISNSAQKEVWRCPKKKRGRGARKSVREGADRGNQGRLGLFSERSPRGITEIRESRTGAPGKKERGQLHFRPTPATTDSMCP